MSEPEHDQPTTTPAPTPAPAPALALVAGQPGGMRPRTAGGPVFVEPVPTADPTKFVVKHPSDGAAYKILDGLQAAGKLRPTPFPLPRGLPEPRLTLADVLGPAGVEVAASIQARGQLVFHAVGDTGNIKGPGTQNLVADTMIADFTETDPAQVPMFFLHLGDIIYNFGETKYYYDQFYEPYRDYPAPIIGLAGNHDGIVAPGTDTPSLQAYLDNLCATEFSVRPEAGALARTAQVQPGVFFTFEAPFVRVLVLYTNTFEDPGVISSQSGLYPELSDAQLDFVRAALTRVKTEAYAGALLIAHHHPAYTAGVLHGWSPDVTAELDAMCTEVGVWPHAVLSAHAHNYQRFSRYHGPTTVSYVVAGGGGHSIRALTTDANGQPLRAPLVIQQPDVTAGTDKVVLENYDGDHYGFLRITATAALLRIEFHPADGSASKAASDSVTIDLATRMFMHYAV